MVTLRPVNASELAAYLAGAAESLAGELARAMRISIDVARRRARAAVAELIPGPDPGDVREGVFLCSVIRDDGGVVGTVLFGHQPADPSRYYVWDIVIEPVCRGRGYGRAAMQAIEAHARSRGVGIVELNVFAHNTVARALYDSLGYAEGGVRMIKQLSS